MKGHHWDVQNNVPDETLLKHLKSKAASVKRRIKEETGVEINPVFYCAGYKEEGKDQCKPYNLTKLLYMIVKMIPKEKRMALADNINKDPDNWIFDDGEEDYKKDWEKAENAVKTILESHNDPDKIYTKIMVNIYDITKNIKSGLCFAGWQGINPYLLLWDLLTLSIADNDFSGNEEKLITHLAEELEIDKSILAEMDNAIRALYSVRAEEKWLKESGRDESEIKDILSQLKKRKAVINNSVKHFF